MRISVFAAIALLLPVPAVANCNASAAPSYSDITYVYVRQYSLVGFRHPSYEFEALAPDPRSVRTPYVTASLNARRAVRFVGSYVAVDPARAFAAIVGALERHHFYDMRMNLQKCCILDGPEDVVTATRCGVTTTLNTISEGGGVDLEDAQRKAFLQMEDELRNTIFAQKWLLPTPPPS